MSQQNATTSYQARKAFDQGLRDIHGPWIVGVDECGRGAWASVIAAAAVVLPADIDIPGINDSKKLSAHQRTLLAAQIQLSAVAWHVEFVSADDIDRYGIQWANRKVMIEAAKRVSEMIAEKYISEISLYVVDQSSAGFTLNPYQMFPRADSKSLSVAAASILAKTTRDNFLSALDEEHPEYHWKDNCGYVNAAHVEAVKAFGLVDGIHRRTYKIKALAPVQVKLEDLL